jgi:hypothetical protein
MLMVIGTGCIDSCKYNCHTVPTPHYVINFVSDLRQVGGVFTLRTPLSTTNNTERNDITEILLKVVLNTKTHQPTTLIECAVSSY